ncbi:MAG: cold shock domain-containing protein [Gammaproteobacteria bacterium]|uniref:Cold shock protein n=1 Tax=hydrothermal vent metagenome TaxID=652676 RepID=A0A1W1E6C9_9ZZZZ|nr:cold shock domain-containing protein [Gammaproteobacteria bacterium]
MAKMEGEVAKFGTKGYGFIAGDDDEQYFVHQKNVFNKSRLKTGTRVAFNVENSDKGWVAIDVELASGGSETTVQSKPLSYGAIKGLFAVLFIVQAAVVYQVFLR